MGSTTTNKIYLPKRILANSLSAASFSFKRIACLSGKTKNLMFNKVVRQAFTSPCVIKFGMSPFSSGKWMAVKVLSRFLLVLILVLVGAEDAFGQKTWVGGTGTGLNWNTAANWSPSGIPTAGADVIFDTPGTITFSTLPTANIAYNSLTISQGTVTLAGTTRTFTLGGNPGTDFMVASDATLVTTNVNITLANNATALIEGTLHNQSGRTFNTDATDVVTTVNGSIINNGTVTSTSALKLLMNSGSTYQHNINGRTIPTATWHANSTCLVTGVTSTLPGGRNQNFGNLTWNNTAQTATTAYGALSIQGNLTIQSTGSGEFRFTNATANSVSGNFIQSGGSVRLAVANATSLTVGGSINISGGTLNLSGGAGVGTLNVAGNYTHNGGTITESSTGSGSIVFNGPSMQTYTSGGTVSNTINFTVNSNAYLQMAASETAVTGGGTFTLQAGATLGVTSGAGITTTGATGNIQVTGTRTFTAGADYIFNGTGNQNTGNGFIANQPRNVTINNSGNTVTLTGNRTISGNLTITSGIFNLGTFTLNRSTLGGILTVAGTLTLEATTGGQTGSNFPLNFSTLTMTGGTVNYNNATGGQTVFSTPTYNNLTLSNSSGTQTAGGALTVNGTLTTTAGGTLNMATHQLLGTLPTVANSGTIRTQNTSATPLPTGKTWGGTVQYDATTGGQTAVGGTFNNLSINNPDGVSTTTDLTVQGVLNLQSTNPSAGNGTLHFSTGTLTMVSSATTVGQGDVSGLVKRTGMIAEFSYTFGNQHTTIIFGSGSTIPSEIIFNIQIGQSPAWKTDAVRRTYDISRAGAITGSGNITLTLHYKDFELNSNMEQNLHPWRYTSSPVSLSKEGLIAHNSSLNTITIALNNITLLPLSPGQHIWTFGEFNQVSISGSKGWRLIASPTATTYADLLDNFVTQGIGGSTFPSRQPNLMWFNETDTLTTNMSWRTLSSMNSHIKPGRGYYFYVFGNVAGDADYNDDLPRPLSVGGRTNFFSGTFSFSGSNHPVTWSSRVGGHTGQGPFVETNLSDEGWNLLGNPSSSTINWKAASGWTKTNIDAATYVWDPAENQWKFTNGHTGNHDGLIPPFQGFWVRANAANPALSFTTDVLSETGGTFYKSQKNNPVTIPLVLSASGLSADAFIIFSQSGMVGPDTNDAYRLDPLSNTWVELFSLSASGHKMPLSINNLPIDGPEYYNIPVFVGGERNGIPINGIYTFSWEIPNNWPTDWSITLHDHKNKRAVSMRQLSSYAFSQNSTKSAPAMMSTDSNHMLNLPDKIFTPVSEQSVAKSSQQLPPFSIIVKKGGEGDETQYVGLTPELMPNFPNPFKDFTTIRFSLPESNWVRIDIYDMFGKLIETVVKDNFTAGVHQLQWHRGRVVSGIYLLRMTTSGDSQTMKLNVF